MTVTEILRTAAGQKQWLFVVGWRLFVVGWRLFVVGVAYKGWKLFVVGVGWRLFASKKTVDRFRFECSDIAPDGTSTPVVRRYSL